MLLSVIIICWNSQPRLIRLLPTLFSATQAFDTEVIVVDNGSTDHTDTFIKESYPAIRYSRLPRNRGVAFARNRGIEQAQGKYVWLLDDDTEVNAEAVTALINHLETHPTCGIAACRLQDADGVLQESFKPFPSLGIKIANLMHRKKASPYSRMIAAGKVFHPVYVIGACQMIRSKTIQQTGLLDEAIFYGPEDADFCLRAVAAGYTVDFLPHISITHHWRRLTTASPLSPLGRAHIRGLLHFWIKHRRFY